MVRSLNGQRPPLKALIPIQGSRGIPHQNARWLMLQLNLDRHGVCRRSVSLTKQSGVTMAPHIDIPAGNFRGHDKQQDR